MYLTLVFRNTLPCDGDFVKPIVEEQPLAEAVDFVRVVRQKLVLTVSCDRCAPSTPYLPRDVRYPFALSVQIRHFRVVTPEWQITTTP